MHKCCADGCSIIVAANFLMCPKHWKLVSRTTQAKVWASYRPGQGVGTASEQWRRASDAAIAEVAAAEKKPQQLVQPKAF